MSDVWLSSQMKCESDAKLWFCRKTSSLPQEVCAQVFRAHGEHVLYSDTAGVVKCQHAISVTNKVYLGNYVPKFPK